jgi:hypothetical protein
VQTLLLSRWHITADMTRKASAMMARAALAVTRAQADDEGLHIDLGLLEGQRSSVEAAQAANAAAKADARQRRAAQAAAAAAAAGVGAGARAAETGELSGPAAADGSSAAGPSGSGQTQQHQAMNKSLVKAQVRALLARQHTAAAPAPAGDSGSASAGSRDGAAGGPAAGKKGGKGGQGPQFVHPSVHSILLFPSYDDGRPAANNAAAAAVLAYEQQLLQSCPQWNPADAANELYRNPYGRGLGGGFGYDASSAGGAAGAGGAADASRRAAACASSLTALPPDADATLLRLHANATREIDAVAAQPASAAYQTLLEAARRRLMRAGSDSLASSPAASVAAGAGSAAVSEVRSRGWYLHSREWTKLRAS